MATDESSVTPSTDPSAEERQRRLKQSLVDFMREFSKESDRAAVVLAGARLNYLLGELLSRFLLPNTASGDELLDTDRPVGTFSARIHAAYRLGLIDGDFARALHIFRRLRNMFAHETAGTSLDHGPSRDRIRELVAPVAQFGAFLGMREKFFKEKSGTAADLFLVSALLVAGLEVACDSVARVSSSKASGLVPPAWKATEEDTS
jgi:hypothetical protein